MKDIVIVGAGGFGREVLQIVRDVGGHRPVGFVDREPRLRDRAIDGVSVLGDDGALGALRAGGVECAFVAVADQERRRNLFTLCKQVGLTLETLVHPAAYVPPSVMLGEGTIVYPGAVVMPGCVIGRGVLVNCGATIGHETAVGDFCNVNPGASIAGRVRLEEAVFVGIGACVREEIVVSEYAVIGAGGVVVRDVPPRATVYGVPSRTRLLAEG